MGGQHGQIQGCGEYSLCRGAMGKTVEGKGCLHKFPVGEKVPASTSQVLWHRLALTSCEALGKLLKFPVLECPTCKMGK